MKRSLDALALQLWMVVGCRVSDAGAGTSDGYGTSTDDGTSTSDAPNDMSADTCGDEVVSEFEECEPHGPVPCENDCTLPADGAGSIEWVFVDDVVGAAQAVAVDEAGNATVAGVKIDLDAAITHAWLGRFEPDGAPGWQVDDDGDGNGASARDVRLNPNGGAVVVGSVRMADQNAWVAAHDDDGVQLWSWTKTPDDGYETEAVAITRLAGQLYVGLKAVSPGLDSDAESRLMIFADDGAPQTTRVWADNITSIISLAAQPSGEQLVQVGTWNDGNWIEALDPDMQTLWTANEPVDGTPRAGSRIVWDVGMDASGGIYVVGEEKDYGPGPFSAWSTIYVRKLTSNGDMDWVVFPSPYGQPKVTVADGTVYVADSTYPESGLMLRAFDADSGALQWQRYVPTADGGTDYASDIEAGLGSLWVAGNRKSDDFPQNTHVYAYVARFRRK
jgi:hypothetical protein